jgi:hypothetical protein
VNITVFLEDTLKELQEIKNKVPNSKNEMKRLENVMKGPGKPLPLPPSM